MKCIVSLATFGLVIALNLPAQAQVIVTVRIGEPAPEMPPGLFTDGGQYHLGDFRGKVLVVFFFDGSLKETRQFIVKNSESIRALKSQPIRFLAVASNVTLPQAKAIQAETGLAVPVFVDSLGLMAARYNFKISNQNIWQVRQIGPTSKIEGLTMDKESLEKLIEAGRAEFKYKPTSYDAKLRPALDLLEIGQVSAGLKLLAPLSKSSNKNLADPAKTLMGEWKTEAEKWKSEADDNTVVDPLKAHDLYQKIATTLPASEDLAKNAAAAAKKLTTDKAVAAELAARKSYTALIQSMGNVTALTGRPAIAASCKALLKKHPNTPTATKIDDLLKELEAAPK
jgi:hypothetical protein